MTALKTSADADAAQPQSSFWGGTFTVFQALEKVLIVIGVPIAAYWTWYTFSTTDTEKARIGYEVRLARARNMGLQVQITCSTAAIGAKQFVTGTVDVFNMGAGQVQMRVSGPDIIRYSKLSFSSKGAPQVTSSIDMPFLTFERRANLGQAFVPQRRRRLPFAFAPPGNGVYFISFKAPVSFQLDEEVFSKPKPWGASATVAVDGQKGNACSPLTQGEG